MKSYYDVTTLVYYEAGEDVKSVIAREKQLKQWKRQWKIDLIEKNNPTWRDLYPDLIGERSDRFGDGADR